MNLTQSDDTTTESRWEKVVRRMDRRKSVERWFNQCALGICSWIGAGWLMPNHAGSLGALGLVCLFGPMLISPLRSSRGGRPRMSELMKPVVWLCVLAVVVIAVWPSDWVIEVEANLFWGSHFHLLDSVFPVGAFVACFCLGGKPVEAGSDADPDSIRARGRKIQRVGLVAAATSALFLTLQSKADDQCSWCSGEGVRVIEFLLPGMSGESLGEHSLACSSCDGTGHRTYAIRPASPYRREDLYSLRRRADTGDAEAQFQLGAVLAWIFRWEVKFPFSGSRLVSSGHPHSWFLLENSAEQGCADAQYVLGRWAFALEAPRYLREMPEEKKLGWLQQAASQGHVRAQYVLADLYLEGDDVPEDVEEGLKWCRLASESEQGLSVAHYRLGQLYADGTGVPKDDERAVELIQRAAEGGLNIAFYSLAERYETGEGVPMDLARAYAWRLYALWDLYATLPSWHEALKDMPLSDDHLTKLGSKMGEDDRRAAKRIALEFLERLLSKTDRESIFHCRMDPIPWEFVRLGWLR
ncbi:MAG: tetratricopeptide repeat protein [bacterium]